MLAKQNSMYTPPPQMLDGCSIWESLQDTTCRESAQRWAPNCELMAAVFNKVQESPGLRRFRFIPINLPMSTTGYMTPVTASRIVSDRA